MANFYKKVDTLQILASVETVPYKLDSKMLYKTLTKLNPS